MTRSQSYQHLYNEIPVDLSTIHRPYDEQEPEDPVMLDLNIAAFAVLIDVIRSGITETQCAVVDGILEGKNQADIAREMGLNQSSVIKYLIGNNDYSKPGRTVYGGLVKRIPKLLLESDEYRKTIIAMLEHEHTEAI